MDCRKFSERFGDFVEELLIPDERRAMEEHLRNCARCRELHTMASKEPGDPEVVVPADLTESILSRTSGPVCASAHMQLCDHVDRLLDPAGDELVGLHLQSCAECEGLFRALSSLRVDLPALAELEPGVEFIGAVLARTRPRGRSRATWIEKLAEEWSKLVKRPRFAWEGAYVGAFVLILIFGTPNAPLASVPKKAKEVVPQLSSAVGSVWEITRNNVIDTSTELAVNVRRHSSAVLETARESLEAARKTLGIARETLETDRENLEAARESLGTAREALGTIWESLPLMQEKDDTDRPADESGPDEGDKP